MKKYSILIGIASFSILTASVRSQITIVDFTATSVSTVGTTNSPPRAKTADTNSGDFWAFSDTVPLFEANGGQNDRIFGGVSSGWVSTTYNPTLTIGGGTSPRRLIFQIHSSTNPSPVGPTTPTSATGIYMWNKVDFMGDFGSSALGFDSNSLLTINFQGLSASSRDVRFVVNNGGTFYVSDLANARTTTGAGVFEKSPTDLTWAMINSTTYVIDSTFSEMSMNDIQGVGIYFNLGGTGTQQIFLSIDDFKATASAIPEPSSIVALAGLGVLGLAASRRRRRE